jgi:hypothetical protein
MTAAIFFAVLVGCALISFAIRARLSGRRRKSHPRPLLVPPSNGHAPAAPPPQAATVKVEASGRIVNDVLPGGIAEDLPGPSETPLPAAATQAAVSADPVHVMFAANIHAAKTIAVEIDSAAGVVFEKITPRPSASLEPPDDYSAPTIQLSEEQPEPSPPTQPVCATPTAPDLSASRAKFTASPATAHLAVIPAVEHVPQLQENKAVGQDTQHAAASLDEQLIYVPEAAIAESAEIPEGDSAPPSHPRDRAISRDESRATVARPTTTVDAQPISTPALEETRGALGREIARTVAIYRAPILAPPIPKKSRTVRSSPIARVSQSSLEVRLQLLTSRTGDVQAGLLFKRPEGFPASLAIKVRSNDVHLSAYGDGWYTADIGSQSNVATTLKEGLIASKHVNGTALTSWMLSAGREIYVAASQPGSAGYHTVPRLALGCAQFVVVREHLQKQVIEILAESCENAVQRLALDRAPLTGWSVFGPVVPLKPVAHQDGDAYLNVIRPLPELAIVLEGGLCLRGAEWLEGFPPRITIAGPIPEGERVLIDNVTASADSTGVYRTPGCDDVGDHTVWCSGKSRTYRISAPPQFWEPWPAHAQRKGTVCGALSEYQAISPQAKLVTVPSSNQVLIGAKPGEVHSASGQGEEWTGIVPFAPVWALPANPFQCRRNAVHVILMAATPVALPSGRKPKPHAVRAWCAAILDCRRKGLQLDSPDAASLWDEYIRAARRTRRSGR